MKYIRVALLTILVLCMYASCRQDASKEKMINLVKKWEKKQVIYPSETTFTMVTIYNFTVNICFCPNK